MSKLNANEQKILTNILNYLSNVFDRIAIRINSSGAPIINSSCYGDLATRDAIENPTEGQIFFVLADELEVEESEEE